MDGASSNHSAFCVLRSSLRDRRGRAWLLLAIVLAVWGLTDVRNRGRVDPGDPLAHKSDFTVYTEAGAAFFDGRNPYDVSNPRGWRYLYPPLFAILVAPLAAIPPQWQAVVWYFISLGVAYCCWRESARLWRFLFPVDFADGAPPAPQTPPNWLGYLAAASLALPALNCLQRGQVGILIAYLLILGFRLIVETRSRFSAIAGGAALAAAIAIKLTPALVVGALLATLAVAAYAARWRGESAGRFVRASAGVALGLVLCIVILPTLAIGAEANIRHLETWLDRVVVHHDMGEDNNSGFYSVRNQSLTNAVERLGNWLAYALAGGPSDTPSDAAGRGALERIDQPGVQRALAPARWCLLVLLAVGCWKAGRRGDTLDWAAMFGLASTATLLV